MSREALPSSRFGQPAGFGPGSAAGGFSAAAGGEWHKGRNRNDNFDVNLMVGHAGAGQPPLNHFLTIKSMKL